MELFISILFIIFIISIIIQLFYVLYFFVRFVVYKPTQTTFNEPISIIVCARNEAENIAIFLPLLLEQIYGDFEVILVDDQSKDNTEYVLKELIQKYPNLKIVKIEKHVKHGIGKKFALTLGIKAAKHEYLLLTDADCSLSSKNWLNNMVANFNNEKQIVLGYGAYKKGKGLLNTMIRFDAFNIALQYFSFALAGETYMGVGRNLAYKKSIFFNNKGFASHIFLPSGDDDLFIQEVATRKNITIEIAEESHTISETKKSWKEWIFQRRRHITTSERYAFKFKILLGLWPLSQFLFWLSFAVLVFFENTLFVVLPLFIFRTLMFYIVYYSPMKKLRSSDLFVWIPLLEILHICIQGIFVLLNSKKKPTSW